MKSIDFIESDEQVIEQGLLRTVLGASQPEYDPLPCLVERTPERRVFTRWQPSENERRAIMDGASIEIALMTFGQPMQPILVGVQGVRYEDGEL